MKIKLKKLIKRKLFWLAIAVILATAGVVFAISKSNNKNNFETTVVQRQDIIQEVSVTGKIKPAQNVDLSFEKSGKIENIYIEIGQEVASGQILLTLESGEIASQLSQAKAQEDVQQANLNQLLQGAKPEEIALLQTKLDNAQKTLLDSQTNLTNVENRATVDLNNYYDDVSGVLNSAYISADDALNKQIDSLFINDDTDNPSLSFQVSNAQVKTQAESQRMLSRDALKEIKNAVIGLTTEQNNLDNGLLLCEAKLVVIRDFLNKLNDGLNASTNLDSTTLNAYKGYVNVSRANVVSSIADTSGQRQTIAGQKALNQQNISQAQAQLTASQNSLDSAQRELELKKSPATDEQIKSQTAGLLAAKANVNNLLAQLAKTIIRSPINGIVAKQETKKGELITAGALAVSVISKANFQIETNVAEADIAKVKVDDTANITLDAYGSDIVFRARVVKIDPAETIIEGVATYKTTLEFIEESGRIRSGLTANIDILTAQKENVLAMPYRAVIEKNGDKVVRVIRNKQQIEERKVETGLRGSGGYIEIISGLSEGDEVVTFEKK